MAVKRKQKKKSAGLISTLLAALILLLAVAVLLPSKQAPQPTETEAPTQPPVLPSPFSPEDFYWEEGLLQCATAEAVMGVDVSSHQQVVDWQQLKQAGVEFAFVRLGYRGYGSGELKQDEYALQNLAGAKAAGIAVGAYVFSQAITVAEAEEEARFALEILGDFRLDMPLVYDWEYVSEDARTAHMDKRTLTDCTLAYCRIVEAAGYEAMVYFNGSQARDLLYLEELTEYRFWLAMYDISLPHPCRVDFWQYTNKGSLPGIEGNVDIDLMFPAE